MKISKINFTHTFAMIRVLNKIEVKEIKANINEMKNSNKGKKMNDDMLADIGMDFIFEILAKYPNAENEIYSLIALLSNTKIKDVKTWELSKIQEFIESFLETNSKEEIVSFFTFVINKMH